MRAIVATEGESEYVALPEVLRGIHSSGGPLHAQVLRVPCQPDGPVAHIAKASHAALKIAEAKGVDRFVLVLDREQREEPPGILAANVLAALNRLGNWSFEVAVVFKDRTFENWLIADLNALRIQRARFTVTEAMVRQVEPNKADRVNAIGLLNKCVKGKKYDKKVDGLNITRRLNVDSAARHSRSLRHFLHVLGHDTYAEQCKRPIL